MGLVDLATCANVMVMMLDKFGLGCPVVCRRSGAEAHLSLSHGLASGDLLDGHGCDHLRPTHGSLASCASSHILRSHLCLACCILDIDRIEHISMVIASIIGRIDLVYHDSLSL